MLPRRLSLPKCSTLSSLRNSVASAAPSSHSSERHSSSLSDPALAPAPAPPTTPALVTCMTSTTSTNEAPTSVANSTAIKVVVRVRPLSERELVAKSPVVVSVSAGSVQVVNPALFTDPTFLVAISTPQRKYNSTNLPVALNAQAIAAAQQAGECRSFHFDRCFGIGVSASTATADANKSESVVLANANDMDTATQRPNQELVFEEIGREMIPSAFQGFNCTVFAYGQTGSGKTHTMVGEKSTARGKGVIPRVCEALFQGIDARRAVENDAAAAVETAVTAAIEAGAPPPASSAKKTVFSVQMSYCEIYKEKVHDLLDGASPTPTSTPTASFSLSGPISMSDTVTTAATPTPVSPVGFTSTRGKILKVREHPLTGPFVEGLSMRLVSSYEEIADEMLSGDKLRTVAATLMNPVSSRSHAMFTLTLTQTMFDGITEVPTIKTSKIAMIDLAGSERANVSGTTGDRLKEGAMINKSLTTLGRVIAALSKASSTGDRVPYRDSTLTWLLKESLGGNAKTTMIAMVSPAAENYDETMSTLRYAESAKRVMNRAVVNEDPNTRVIRQLRDEIQQLRSQLAKRETEAFFLVENLKESVELPAGKQDRDEFYRDVQDELESYRTQVETLLRKQTERDEQLQRASRVVRLHAKYPSLLNLTPASKMRTDDVLVCTLREGTSVVGSKHAPIEAVESVIIGESRSPRRLVRSTSWAGSFLKRRKSSAATELSEDAAPSSSSSSSPRKRSHSYGASSQIPAERLTEEPTNFVRLPPLADEDEVEGENVLPRHAVLVVRARAVAPSEDAVDVFDEMTEYVVELQPISTDAAVYVNGNRVTAVKSRTRVVHGDVLGFGCHHRYCLHVPQLAAARAQAKPAPLDELITEANALCDKWHLHMQFAMSTASDSSANSESTCVLAQKRLADERVVTVQWTRAMLQNKLEGLRSLAASLEPVGADVAMVREEQWSNKATKMSAARGADRVSNAASESESSADETRAKHASMSMMDGHYSTFADTTLAAAHATATTIAPLQLPAQALSVRLLGHTRIYLSGLSLAKPSRDVAMSVPGYDGSGRQIARVHCQLRAVAIAGVRGESDTPADAAAAVEASGGVFKCGLSSFLSPRNRANTTTTHQAAAARARPSSVRLQLVVDRVEFLRAAVVCEHVSLTLKKWTASGEERADQDETMAAASGAPIESTAKASAVVTDETVVFPFHHTMQFTTTATENGTVVCDDFVAVEMWGYSELVFPPTCAPTAQRSSVLSTHRIELFVSVDIEERDADGFFRPVAVKSDGALRLHVHQPRRVTLRVTQADHGPFMLRDFALARLSASFSTPSASNLALGVGKSVQTLLLPTVSTSARSAATTETDELPTFRDWLKLFPRSAAELDASSRSLTVSLRWERGSSEQPAETADGADARSVFRLAVAIQTTLSPVPVVVSKSVVTKLSALDVSSSQRLAREWENSRMAWWARESSSRSYRLGTWYCVDVVPHSLDDTNRLSTNAAVTAEKTIIVDPSQDGDILEPPAQVALMNAHIQGLRRLELCAAMERVRQEILARHLTTRASSDESPLTLERAQECFEQLLASTEQPPVVKVLLLDDGDIYLRHKASNDVFVAVKSGNVTASPLGESMDQQDSNRQREHVAHFVSEPSSLTGRGESGAGAGDMCGFLLFSTSVQLDESAVAGTVAPTVSANALGSPTSPLGPGSNNTNPLAWARNSLTNRLSWERRWFVLKRPFLYAYKSFARKEPIGVLDVGRCQLVVPSSSASSSSSSSFSTRRASLSGVMGSRRSSKSETGAAGGGGGSSTGGAFPFCFQLVSLSGAKCVVWSLQVSTSAELRAWLVAIDPLKIEALEALAGATAAQIQLDGGAAVLTA